MSQSQKQLYYYSPEGLALVKNTGTGATVMLRAAGQTLAQRDDIQTAFYAADLQGSVLRCIGRNSSSVMQYMVYGWDSQGADASLLRFTGQRKESLSGHYLLGDGYRALSPWLMRFNAPDILSPFGEGGLNAYCYCSNDPVNKMDPSGHLGVPPNSFLNGGLFTKRWGLRSAASYAFGPKAPALKTLGVKKALSEIDATLPGRIKHAERNQSWQLSDVERLKNAAITLQGRANRFELADANFKTEGLHLEAQAARETRVEVLAIKQWVDGKIVKAEEVFKKRLFDVLPFFEPTEQVPKVRRGG